MKFDETVDGDSLSLYPFPVQNWTIEHHVFRTNWFTRVTLPRKFTGWNTLPPNHPHVIQYESGMKQVSILILAIKLSLVFIRCSTSVTTLCHFSLRFYHVDKFTIAVKFIIVVFILLLNSRSSRKLKRNVRRCERFLERRPRRKDFSDVIKSSLETRFTKINPSEIRGNEDVIDSDV